MAENRGRKDRESRKERERRENREDSGVPGGGAGRKDEAGGSGVYPASAGPGNIPDDAVVRGPAEWGQGDLGAAGYEESGRSEIFYTEEELRWIREQEKKKESGS